MCKIKAEAVRGHASDVLKIKKKDEYLKTNHITTPISKDNSYEVRYIEWSVEV